MKIAIPWWLTIIIVIETIPMFVGPFFALTNETFIGGADATAITYQAYIYSARNIAVGLAFIIAFILKNGPMLFILIFIRLITDLIDLPTALSFGLATNEIRLIAIFVFLYYIPALIALQYLRQQLKTPNPKPPQTQPKSCIPMPGV